MYCFLIIRGCIILFELKTFLKSKIQFLPKILYSINLLRVIIFFLANIIPESSLLYSIFLFISSTCLLQELWSYRYDQYYGSSKFCIGSRFWSQLEYDLISKTIFSKLHLLTKKIIFQKISDFLMFLGSGSGYPDQEHVNDYIIIIITKPYIYGVSQNNF